MLPDVGGYAFSRCAADARAHFLDDGHKGIGEQQRPGNCEAELCSCLRVSGNAARIIICGAGDKTWPKRTKNTAAFQTRCETVCLLRDRRHLADRHLE